mmetsp:Transcript_30332/g.48850  ORF Transcript_30332/g.48850 Transcript_30332/m.48850 type:complete len:141 (-) Transcript_30332:1051-1473(-)
MTMSSEEDAVKMGSALAAMQSPSSTSSATSVLATEGMTVSELQFSSFSGSPSTYFARASTNGTGSPSPPFDSKLALSLPPDKTSKMSQINQLAIAVEGLLVITLVGLVYHYEYSPQAHVSSHAECQERLGKLSFHARRRR